MYRARNILISPVRAVLNDLDDPTADFILCSSETVVSTDGRPNVLFLRFFDTEEENSFMCFRQSDAERIVSFLSRSKANEDLFVCCDSGESRSPAIAAAILLAAGKTDRDIWRSTEYHPNLLVFRKMCRALDLDIPEDAIRERKRSNDTVFHEALTRGKTGAP